MPPLFTSLPTIKGDNDMEDMNMEQVQGNEAPADQGTGNPSEKPGKTFTQDEVNQIVERRIARERAKLHDEHERQARISDLDAREQKLIIRERKADAAAELASKGLPSSFLDLLNYDSDDSYQESLLAAERAYDDMYQAIIKIKATGTTPKNYGEGQHADNIAKAFGLK